MVQLVLLTLGLLPWGTLARDVPSNVKSFYDGIRSAGKCGNPLASGFYSTSEGTNSYSYCGDHLDKDGVIYIQGSNGDLTNMDIDCDGTQGGPGNDRRCGYSADTQSQTSFQEAVAGYNKGVGDLNPYVHPYVVFGNVGTRSGFANFDPQSHGVEPLSLMAVVCGDKLIYGIWGDENGDDDDKSLVGEASISLATACFGRGMTGGSGHDDNDVLFVAFAGPDAVPGADGADWAAGSYDDFAKSIEGLGDKLVQRIGGSGDYDTGNSSSGSRPAARPSSLHAVTRLNCLTLRYGNKWNTKAVGTGHLTALLSFFSPPIRLRALVLPHLFIIQKSEPTRAQLRNLADVHNRVRARPVPGVPWQDIRCRSKVDKVLGTWPPAAVDMPEESSVAGATRIKRNTACTSCRDAKVRCNPSSDPAQPCQRCSKLNLQCVVDKTHKRVSRKSKLDELVQEIQSIKQSVGDRPVTQQATGLPSPFKDHVMPRIGIPSPELSRLSVSHSSNHATTVSTGQTPAPTFVVETNIEPSTSRALGNMPFSGPDIDYYFQKYFEHFHPYMPIVRHRDPNKLYDTGGVLFWTIIMIACRRYARDPKALAFLTEAVRDEMFSAISKLPLSIHVVNALILVNTWVFPDVRFISDPTSIFSGVIMNAALLLGIHSGKGSHPEYSIGMFQNNFSDEEAHYTMAEYRGLPPVGSIFNQTVQNVIDGNTPFTVSGSFRVLLECQKFANRVSKTMAACLDETRGVSSHLVRHLEDEFDHIRGLICSERADDLDRWNALLVQLEIQAYYLIPLPGYNPENLKRNVIRAYTTAQTVVQVALELERSHGFLKHMPHFYFRSLISAHCIIYKVLRSSYTDFLDRAQAEQAATEVIETCRQSRVMEGDLPERLGNLLESIWNWAQLARWHEEPVSIFSHRLSASIVFDCLKRWKSDMDSRPKSQPPPADGTETPAVVPVPDPLANIDWSFMDDFDWNMEPTLLGPGIAPGIAP